MQVVQNALQYKAQTTVKLAQKRKYQPHIPVLGASGCSSLLLVVFFFPNGSLIFHFRLPDFSPADDVGSYNAIQHAALQWTHSCELCITLWKWLVQLGYMIRMYWHFPYNVGYTAPEGLRLARVTGMQC